MQPANPKWTSVIVAAAVIGIVCLLCWLRLEPFERVEWMTYDWRVRLAKGRSSYAATNLGVVRMTDDTLDAIKTGLVFLPWGTNQAPTQVRLTQVKSGLYWPRHVYGRLVRELKAQGAVAVGFDVFFGELREDHAPISVRGLLRQATNDTLVQEFVKTKAIVALYDDLVSIVPDAFFALQLRATENVILAGTSHGVPPALFRTNALALGEISAERDADGVLRRTRAFWYYRQWHPAFYKAGQDAGYQLAKAIVKNDRIILPHEKTKPLTVFLDANGNFDLMNFVEGDTLPQGFNRWEKPFTDEKRLWSLGLVLAASELHLDLEHAEIDLDHGRIVLRGPGNVTRTIPVDRDGWFYVDWELTANDRRLTTESLESLIARDELRSRGVTNRESEQWAGKLAVIGSEATGNEFTDTGATPLESNIPLMTQHWNIANSLLLGRFVTRAGTGLEMSVIILMGAISAFLTIRLRILFALGAVIAAVAGYTIVAAWIYIADRQWLPMALPIFGGGFVQYAVLATYRVIFEQDEKRKVKSLFSRLVSPNIVNELLQVKQLSLGGARREISVLFADVRGFTELTDKTYEKALREIAERKLGNEEAERYLDDTARQTLETVNLYLGMLADIVKRHDGTLDKYIGDCVMAFWGAPSPQPMHALACVRAAIEGQRSILRLNQERQVENERREAENTKRQTAGQPLLPILPLLQMGSGINTGVASVGLMGSDEHIYNYTVFGREVNLASRLESLSGRGRIIVGETTFKHLQREAPQLACTCTALQPEKIKGFRDTVQVYEVPWQQAEADADKPGPQSEPLPA